ncbi:hypothetical protein HK100_005617 [Physocladia obscura]|uniref:Chromo domain-containing protein n=1 Tax=Physocladia obscura TaxID=109957 RepID=A0AAD5XFF6_9FUNG|nr:hypothetical protein HK100_005617 [Physocladia obscura]
MKSKAHNTPSGRGSCKTGPKKILSARITPIAGSQFNNSPNPTSAKLYKPKQNKTYTAKPRNDALADIDYLTGYEEVDEHNLTSGVYLVEAIREHRLNAAENFDILVNRQQQGWPEFLVKWRGYSEEENTWEPPSSFHPSYLQEYCTEREIPFEDFGHMPKKMKLTVPPAVLAIPTVHLNTSSAGTIASHLRPKYTSTSRLKRKSMAPSPEIPPLKPKITAKSPSKPRGRLPSCKNSVIQTPEQTRNTKRASANESDLSILFEGDRKAEKATNAKRASCLKKIKNAKHSPVSESDVIFLSDGEQQQHAEKTENAKRVSVSSADAKIGSENTQAPVTLKEEYKIDGVCADEDSYIPKQIQEQIDWERYVLRIRAIDQGFGEVGNDKSRLRVKIRWNKGILNEGMRDLNVPVVRARQKLETKLLDYFIDHIPEL